MDSDRPFYSEFGWAYDLLVDDPVEPWVDSVEAALRQRGLALPARVLDAGCGTGRHAAALAHRGHELVLLEPEPALLAQASKRLPAAQALAARLDASLKVVPPVDAAMCRGVLNDLVDDVERESALVALARAVRPGGVLVLDVRERDATASRYGNGRTLRREAGGLAFTAEGRWDGAAGLVRVRERHEVRLPRAAAAAPPRLVECDFVMRPWAEEELHEGLVRAGLSDISIRPGRESRLLVAATR